MGTRLLFKKVYLLVLRHLHQKQKKRYLFFQIHILFYSITITPRLNYLCQISICIARNLTVVAYVLVLVDSKKFHLKMINNLNILSWYTLNHFSNFSNLFKMPPTQRPSKF